MANGHGGLRTPKGQRIGGIQKGGKWRTTLEKEEARELVRQITQYLGPMIHAQVQHAIGISHMFLRREDGTFERSDDPDAIPEALNSGDSTSYYVFTKDPSVQAFTDLMNRSIDKPKEQPQEVITTNTAEREALVAILDNWKRTNALKKAERQAIDVKAKALPAASKKEPAD
jgi:hypothetical protein